MLIVYYYQVDVFNVQSSIAMLQGTRVDYEVLNVPSLALCELVRYKGVCCIVLRALSRYRTEKQL